MLLSVDTVHINQSSLQKLKIAGLCWSIHPLVVHGEERYYFICVSLTDCWSEEGVPYSNKNDSHLD